MRFLKYLSVFAFGLLLLVGAQANAQTSESASDFINRAGNQALTILSTKSVKTAEGNAAFNQFMLDNFDIPAIGKFVLGRGAATATPEQMTEYNSLFQKLVQQIYTQRLSAFQGETFKVTGERAEGDAGDKTVSTAINHTNGAPATNTDWRVRPENGTWKIVDVTVEGVSMSVTQRSEFASVLQRSGGKMDGLLAALRQRTGS